jgi:transposase
VARSRPPKPPRRGHGQEGAARVALLPRPRQRQRSQGGRVITIVNGAKVPSHAQIDRRSTREQLRDLVCCREDIRVDLMRARHRIGKFLLRREIYWEGTGERWSRKHRSWLTSVRFADHASQATLPGLSARARRADRTPRPGRSQARVQRPVRAHGRSVAVPARDRHAARRWGCARRSASGSASIIPTSSLPISGSFPASTPAALSAASGRSPRAGFTHARRLLVEAAYHYRRGPAVGEALERRQRGQAPEIIHISWRAQRRLNARWRQLKDTRHKPGGIVAVAIARELAAYCWEIATCPTAPKPTPTPTTRRRLTNSR